jgi:putative membrane protein
MRYLIHTVITAVALWVATAIPGVNVGGTFAVGTHEDPVPRITTLLVVALIFGVVNTVIKPVVKFFGCALYALTLGLFGLVVNALLFLLTAWISDRLHVPFHVAGFVPAFFAAIVVSIVSFVLHLIFDRFERDRERHHDGYFHHDNDYYHRRHYDNY